MNERKLIEMLNEKYKELEANSDYTLTDRDKMLIETGVAYGITFAVQTLGTIKIDQILGQY